MTFSENARLIGGPMTNVPDIVMWISYLSSIIFLYIAFKLGFKVISTKKPGKEKTKDIQNLATYLFLSIIIFGLGEYLNHYYVINTVIG